MSEPLRYRAFISYSHRDAALTQRLHRRLESYRVPRALVGTQADGRVVPARLQPIFRDRDELASAAQLSRSIEEALDQSECLIVVCSPTAMASRWVNEEIRYFRTRHAARPVFAFVASGDPGADPRVAPTAAFPPALILADPDVVDGPLGEPIAADARDEGDGFSAAFVKLAAGMLGLRYDQLRRREQRRRQQRWMLAGAVSMSLTAVFAFLAWQATVARDAARASQAVAELELQSERETRNFLLSVFHLADANEARGNTVTVREALDRAVQRIDSTPFSRPAIRSRFLATMGQAYSSLGLNRRSAELLRASADTLPADDASSESAQLRADALVGLADVQYDMGDYESALATLAPVLRAPPTDERSALQQVEAENLRGHVLTYLERDDDARTAYQEALRRIDSIRAAPADLALLRASSVSGLAQLELFAGDAVAAGHRYDEAVEMLVATVGELHTDTISAVASSGSSAYQRSDYVAARAAWTRALTAAQKVYDPLSPQLGTLQNNLGLLMLETGELTQAETLLREALASDRKHRSATFDDLAYPLNSLANVRLALGDRVEARALLDEARGIAEPIEHRMLGPILNTLAELDCDAEAAAAGVGLAERAIAANAEHYEADHWYVAQAQLTLGYCRAKAGEPIERATLQSHIDAVRAKWKDAASPFRQRAEAQWKALRVRR